MAKPACRALIRQGCDTVNFNTICMMMQYAYMTELHGNNNNRGSQLAVSCAFKKSYKFKLSSKTYNYIRSYLCSASSNKRGNKLWEINKKVCTTHCKYFIKCIISYCLYIYITVDNRAVPLYLLSMIYLANG